MTVPTPLIAITIFAIDMAATTGLLIAGVAVPVEFTYVLIGSATAALGGAVPSVNIGKPSA